MIVNPAHVAEVQALVSPSHFYRQAHQDIFDAICELAEHGTAIDSVTLNDCLSRHGKLDAVGGPAYLYQVVDGVPRSINAAYYAELVRRDALAREAVQLLRRSADQICTNPAVIGNGLPAAFQQAWDQVITAATATAEAGLAEADLTDAVDVAAEGRALEEAGVPQLLHGIIPFLGVLGFLVAYAKVGKTTFGQAMAAAIAMGRVFLGHLTTTARVLVLAAEDPPEYTAFVSRHLDVAPGRMTFYRKPIILDNHGLAQVIATVRQGGYGLVLISSWQAVVRGLIGDENDNAGAVRVVEDVKAAARLTGVPWLVDAHAGKGEDHDDDADPSRAMRGASAAAGAADFTLHLRYANGAFGTQRKLSGKGRFVNFPCMTFDYDPITGAFTVLGDSKGATKETTWRLIIEMGALSTDARSIAEIGRRIGFQKEGKRLSGTQRKQIADALHGRSDVGRVEETRQGRKTMCYRLLGTGL